MLYASENQSLPAAYSGRATRVAGRGGLQVNQALLDYLEPRTEGATFLMAVPSSMQGADYVLAIGRAVMYMGGFMGQDQVVTTQQLARLVGEGALRYVMWDGRSGGIRSSARRSSSSPAPCSPRLHSPGSRGIACFLWRCS